MIYIDKKTKVIALIILSMVTVKRKCVILIVFVPCPYHINILLCTYYTYDLPVISEKLQYRTFMYCIYCFNYVV